MAKLYKINQTARTEAVSNASHELKKLADRMLKRPWDEWAANEEFDEEKVKAVMKDLRAAFKTL